MNFLLEPSLTGLKRKRVDKLISLWGTNTFPFPEGEVNLRFLENKQCYDIETNTIYMPEGCLTPGIKSTYRSRARTLLHETFHWYDVTGLTHKQRQDAFLFITGLEAKNPSIYPWPWHKAEDGTFTEWFGGTSWEKRIGEQFAATCENSFWPDTTNFEWFNSAGMTKWAVRPTDRRADFKNFMLGLAQTKAA